MGSLTIIFRQQTTCSIVGVRRCYLCRRTRALNGADKLTCGVINIRGDLAGRIQGAHHLPSSVILEMGAIP